MGVFGCAPHRGGKAIKGEPEAAALFLPTVRKLGGASPHTAGAQLTLSVLLSPVPLPMG